MKINLKKSFHRFLRRLEQSIKQKEQISPCDSAHEDGGDDFLRVTTPLLQPSKKPIIKMMRQKRVVCIHPNEKLWREREKGLIHGDILSD